MLGAKGLIDFKTKTEARTFPFPPTGDTRPPRPVFPMVANSHEKSNLLNEKTRVGFGSTEVSVHHSKAPREIFRMGMVSGVLVSKGSNSWAVWSIRFQQLIRLQTIFTKRLNENVQISVFRAETDTK